MQAPPPPLARQSSRLTRSASCCRGRASTSTWRASTRSACASARSSARAASTSPAWMRSRAAVVVFLFCFGVGGGGGGDQRARRWRRRAGSAPSHWVLGGIATRLQCLSTAVHAASRAEQASRHQLSPWQNTRDNPPSSHSLSTLPGAVLLCMTSRRASVPIVRRSSSAMSACTRSIRRCARWLLSWCFFAGASRRTQRETRVQSSNWRPRNVAGGVLLNARALGSRSMFGSWGSVTLHACGERRLSSFADAAAVLCTWQ